MWCWEDKECEELKKALNRFSGVECYEWCWGHGKNPFMIRFTVKKPINIKPILGALIDSAPDPGEDDIENPWTLEVEYNFIADDVNYRLRGPLLERVEDIPRVTRRLIQAMARRSIRSWQVK